MHQSSPRISVVICSYNRLEFLKLSFGSVASQLAMTPCAELIVVDDGSTDGSQAWLASLPPTAGIRILLQENQGLSAARNAGWRAAAGEWIAFIDDDVLPPENWLGSMTAACTQAKNTIGVIGGPVHLKWSAPQPNWFCPALTVWLSEFKAGELPLESSVELHFVGANMCCRKEALKQVGGFDPHLGRKGNSLLSREESQLGESLSKLGYLSRYEPSPWVWHHAHPERLHRRWFLRRVYWEGISQQYGRHEEIGKLRKKARACLYATKRLGPAKIFRALFTRSSQVRMTILTDLAFHAGVVRGIWTSS